jgi:membrane protein DedA with SNARE-associated domain
MIHKLLAALAGFVITVITYTSYWGIIFTMALESACIPLPSEVIMPFSGYLVSQGKLDFWMVIFAGTAGNLIGSLLAWWVGLKGGRPLIERYGRYILLTKHDLDRAERWFSRYGEVTVFFTRMMPIVRTFISLPAGIGKMPLWRFSVYTFLGAIPWNWFLATVGVKLGENWEDLKQYFQRADIVIAALLLIGIAWFVRRHIKYRVKPGDAEGPHDSTPQ